jgi:serine phosphatase RsbU (regulator of sigma subunit)
MRVAMRTAEVDGPGGDFSRALETAPDRLVFVVGDVTGHGARAARHRAVLLERLGCLPRVTGQGGPCAAQVLVQMNLAVHGRWPSDVLAGVVCVDVDARRRQATIAVAGHLPPVFKSTRGTRVLPVLVGPAVGMFPDARYVETSIDLTEGGVLVVATDGISDVFTAAADPLGLSALEQSIAHAPEEPEGLCTFVFESATRHGALEDDATIVALELWSHVLPQRSTALLRTVEEGPGPAPRSGLLPPAAG